MNDLHARRATKSIQIQSACNLHACVRVTVCKCVTSSLRTACHGMPHAAWRALDDDGGLKTLCRNTEQVDGRRGKQPLRTFEM
eukprot:5848181-Alexandrium_andersonii.AAC.1